MLSLPMLLQARRPAPHHFRPSYNHHLGCGILVSLMARVGRNVAFMPLSSALLDIPLTRPCPHCGHKLEKTGNWFSSIARYKCAKCRQELRMTYEAKLALFEAYGTVTKKRPPVKLR